MPEITAALVKQLRDATNVSMMECKKALVDANGDLDEAGKLLRERGVAVAAKKADRVANQGLIASASDSEGNTVSLVEVNCETDFVARNENFQAFVNELAGEAVESDASLAETRADDITAKIAEIGENIIVRRNTRYSVSGNGGVCAYVHSNGKIGVLIELDCTKDTTAGQEAFKDLIKDLSLHVAAANPRFLSPEEVPEPEVNAEKEIFAKQVEGKPAQVVEKIVEGKLRKYYEEICFLKQGFIKEPKQSIESLLETTAKSLDDTLTVRRFERYQIGG